MSHHFHAYLLESLHDFGREVHGVELTVRIERNEPTPRLRRRLGLAQSKPCETEQ